MFEMLVSPSWQAKLGVGDCRLEQFEQTYITRVNARFHYDYVP